MEQLSRNNLDSSNISSLVKLTGYEVHRLLSEGSFAEVFEATDLNKKRKVAVKRILKSQIKKQKREREIYIERYVLSSLDHPGLIQFYSCLQDQDYLYFVLEYCPFGDFSLYLPTLTSTQIKMYIYQLVSVISFLHSKGIAHLDVKPNNLVIDSNYNIKLIDFGTCFFFDKTKQPEKLAQNLEKLSKKIEVFSPIFAGTPEYVSPEMLEDSCASKEADLWAIGCIIYECYTGKQPFTDKSENDLFQNILHLKYDLENPKIPADAKDLIKKLLQLNPQDRLGSIDTNEILAHSYFNSLQGYSPWNSKLLMPDNDEPILQIKSTLNSDDNVLEVATFYKCSTATNLKLSSLITYEIVTVLGEGWFCLPIPAILWAYYGSFTLQLIEKRKTRQRIIEIDRDTLLIKAGSVYYIEKNNKQIVKFKSSGEVEWVQVFNQMQN